jgi:hypothetical protein
MWIDINCYFSSIRRAIYVRIEKQKDIPQCDMLGTSIQGHINNLAIEEREYFHIRPLSSFDQHFGQLCGYTRE